MYEELYLHRTVIAAAICIEAMILEAASEIDYVKKTKNIESFIYLNDSSVFEEILNSNIFPAKKYAKLLYERKLPKMISEKKFVLPRTMKHVSGIQFLNDNKVLWKSRTLSKDFISEFEKYDIHIRRGNNLYTFREYCTLENIENSSDKWYYERVYQF